MANPLGDPVEKTRKERGIAVSREGPVLRLHLDRPTLRNALHGDAFRALAEAVEEATDEDALRVIQLSAEGDHFCAGADLEASNAPRAGRPRTGHMVRGLARGAHRAIRAMHECPLPIVAGVRGYAAGFGCNLALAADFVVASETARFVEPFVDRGLTPDSGSTWLLPRLVGLARARRMLLLGETIPGREAADWGLVHEVVPDPELDARVGSLVEGLAKAATLSVGLAKSLLHRGLDTDLAVALDNEAYAEELAIRSLDFKEGLSAFRERRKPGFEGR
jgi:2-(1,2-epoxy-1,2-dihydrophenyl)acetyl-CoA isomerase